MAARKRAPDADPARLAELASAGGPAFAEYAVGMLESGNRLAREAALQALAEHAAPDARDALRKLYFELHADGSRRDQGAIMRGDIVRALRAIGDVRDADIAVLAADTSETAFGQDITWQLRAHGLMLLWDLAPARIAFCAVEHLNDAAGADDEPAATALKLLAGTANELAIYQWLVSVDADSALVALALEMLADADRELASRYVERAVDDALRRDLEPRLTTLADAMIRLELREAYGSLERALSSRISDELFNYLAMLLAATNRPPLLEILERQLRPGGRSRLIVEALQVRTTDEQVAILRRWEERA